MNWTKLLANIGGVLVAAVAICHALSPDGTPIVAKATGVCAIIAVVANLIGLHQTPPQKTPGA